MTRAEIEGVAKALSGAEKSGLLMCRPGQSMAMVAISPRMRVALFTKGLVERARDQEDEDDPVLFRPTLAGIAVRDFLREGGDGTERT